jgi:hypothetical protein
MYKYYDNDTFFKAVHWAKRNIRKGKSRLNTYKAAERYYGVDADKIQNYLLKYEKDFMSIDYRKYPNHTITDYKSQKKAELLSYSLDTSETPFEMYVKQSDDQYPQDYTPDDINLIESARLNKILKENSQLKTKQSKVHKDPYADM